MLLEEFLLVTWVKLVDNKSTLCLDITSLVVGSYGYNSGQIEQRVAHEWRCTGRHMEVCDHRVAACSRRML